MVADEVLGSFEAKWAGAHPELALALRFVPPAARARTLGLAVIGLEIEDAAFRIAEDHVAEAKLHWWAEELARTLDGKPRHPATQAISEDGGRLPSIAWETVILGALAVREAPSAGSAAALLDGYGGVFAPLARADAAAYPGVSAEVTAQAGSLTRALQELADLRAALGRGRLPLPLDLLARHQLDRGDLPTRSPACDAAVREWLRQLAARMQALPWRELPLLTGARLSADAGRARRAARADDPIAALAAERHRIGPSTAWRVWRLARRRMA